MAPCPVVTAWESFSLFIFTFKSLIKVSTSNSASQSSQTGLCLQQPMQEGILGYRGRVILTHVLSGGLSTSETFEPAAQADGSHLLFSLPQRLQHLPRGVHTHVLPSPAVLKKTNTSTHLSCLLFFKENALSSICLVLLNQTSSHFICLSTLSNSSPQQQTVSKAVAIKVAFSMEKYCI